MKKFLLLTFCALFGLVQGSFAQLTVTLADGTEVKDGDILTIYAFETVNEFDEVEVATKSNDPLFRSATATPVNFEVAITIPAKASMKCQWCGIEMDCSYAPQGKSVRKGQATNSIIAKTMQLHAHFDAGVYDDYTVPVEVKVAGRKDRTFYMHFVYDQEHATGIEGVEAGNNGVKFMDNVCHYSFAAAAPRALQVYGMDGKLVYNTAISAEQGSVSLNALQKGVYVYSIVENGEKVLAGKVLVK